ncbi:MAG: 50S ribosomal protein L18Ae [Candidatus Methanofastidiosia archaeon]
MSEKSEVKSTSKSKKPKDTGKVKQKKSPAKGKEKKVKTFTITGKFVMGDLPQKFKKDVNARGEKLARERIYQDLGSKHRVRRSRVLIDAVEEAK